MPRVGFDPTILAFERTKTVHVLDRATTVIGIVGTHYIEVKLGQQVSLLWSRE
jgi:hypothetical protein